MLENYSANLETLLGKTQRNLATLRAEKRGLSAWRRTHTAGVPTHLKVIAGQKRASERASELVPKSVAD